MAETTTTTMVTTIGATVAKNLLMIAGASLASHGLIAGSGVETFVSIGMVAIGAAWSFWNSYGRAIMVAKLQVWKAKAEAQADALHKANVPVPTAAQIADKIPDPAVTADVVAKVTAMSVALILAVLLTTSAIAAPKSKSTDLSSQLRKGPIATAIENKLNPGASGDAGSDLLGALEAKLLPDLKYALNVASGSNDTLTAPCWSAWITMIEARQKANVDDQGNELPMPDPALITRFQKLMDIRNALQPTSPFMRACSPVAGVVKSDIRKFIGLILTGGAGLAAMGIGL